MGLPARALGEGRFLPQLVPCLGYGPAPGWPGARPTWGASRKVGLGTALGSPSRVWFTLAEGILTEVYYPRVDKPNLRALKLLVVKEGKVVDEEYDLEHSVSLVDPWALAWRQVNRDPAGRYRIVKTTITHPQYETVLINVKFEVLEGNLEDYRLYLYADPHLNNSGMGDSGFWAKACRHTHNLEACLQKGACPYREVGQDFLLAQDGPVAMALTTTLPWRQASVGYVGSSDGLADLRQGGELKQTYSYAGKGNIALLAELDLTAAEFTIALGFGESVTRAAGQAGEALATPFAEVAREYIRDWRKYCGSLDNLGGAATPLYYVSAMVLRALEDKENPGGMVASLAIPWGEGWDDGNCGGYHLVWARDLYHAAMAFLAVGDRAAANRAFEYIVRRQQKEDGSVQQNTWLDGTPYWNNVQMDEVAVIPLLAWWLGRKDYYWQAVKPAADYLIAHGPLTPQERWEENSGYSPSTLAAEIAGLVCAAELAREAGDQEGEARYLATADSWQAKVEEWCFTHTGPFGDGRYYLRVAGEGGPDAGRRVELANRQGIRDERELVDAGFLELVRLGVKPAADPAILQSLAVVDRYLRVQTPKGPSFYRYTYDGYGEPSETEIYRGGGKGRLWTLLTGERGHYELARGNLTAVDEALTALERFANAGLLLPEQVWEKNGEPTGSATPLAWSHAEYICLLKSRTLGRVFDCPPPVAVRYGQGRKKNP